MISKFWNWLRNRCFVEQLPLGRFTVRKHRHWLGCVYYDPADGEFWVKPYFLTNDIELALRIAASLNNESPRYYP